MSPAAGGALGSGALLQRPPIHFQAPEPWPGAGLELELSCIYLETERIGRSSHTQFEARMLLSMGNQPGRREGCLQPYGLGQQEGCVCGALTALPHSTGFPCSSLPPGSQM